jgi:hypothetical protein
MSFLNPEHGETIAEITELKGRKCYFNFIDFCAESLGVNVSKKYNKSLTELQDDYFYCSVECYIFKAEVLHNFVRAPFIEYSLLPVDAEQAKELLKDFTIDDNLSMYKNLILEVLGQYISEIERNKNDFAQNLNNFIKI